MSDNNKDLPARIGQTGVTKETPRGGIGQTFRGESTGRPSRRSRREKVDTRELLNTELAELNEILFVDGIRYYARPAEGKTREEGEWCIQKATDVTERAPKGHRDMTFLAIPVENVYTSGRVPEKSMVEIYAMIALDLLNNETLDPEALEEVHAYFARKGLTNIRTEEPTDTTDLPSIHHDS